MKCTDVDVVLEKLDDSSKEWLIVRVMLETNFTTDVIYIILIYKNKIYNRGSLHH